MLLNIKHGKMPGDIVKTKFLCKSSSQTGSASPNAVWHDRFIKDKWYDCEYQKWGSNNDQMYRMNNGWYKYWAINESGRKEELSRAEFNIIFANVSEVRNIKINEILNKEN